MTELPESIIREQNETLRKHAVHMEEKLVNLRIQLFKAEKVISIIEHLLDPRCEDFHHVKGDRHHGDRCSIVTGYEEAMRDYRGGET